MADRRSGEAVRGPVQFVGPNPQSVNNSPPYYLDGAPIEECDAIRWVRDPEVSTGPTGGPGTGVGHTTGVAGPQLPTAPLTFGFATDNGANREVPTSASGSTKVLLGTGSAALVANDNRGIVRFTTSAVAGNGAGASLSGTTVAAYQLLINTAGAGKIPNGKRYWVTSALRIPSGDPDVTTGSFIFGLVPTVTVATIPNPASGVAFLKSTGNGTVDFWVNGVKSLTDVHTLAGQTALTAGTFTEYSFYIDNSGNVYAYVNGVLAGTVALTTDQTSLFFVVARDNGVTAAARNLDQDYELFAGEV